MQLLKHSWCLLWRRSDVCVTPARQRERNSLEFLLVLSMSSGLIVYCFIYFDYIHKLPVSSKQCGLALVSSSLEFFQFSWPGKQFYLLLTMSPLLHWIFFFFVCVWLPDISTFKLKASIRKIWCYLQIPAYQVYRTKPDLSTVLKIWSWIKYSWI